MQEITGIGPGALEVRGLSLRPIQPSGPLQQLTADRVALKYSLMGLLRQGAAGLSRVESAVPVGEPVSEPTETEAVAAAGESPQVPEDEVAANEDGTLQ